MDQGVDDLFPLLAFNPKISPQSAQRPQRATVFQRIRETRLFRNFRISSRHLTIEGRKYRGFLCAPTARPLVPASFAVQMQCLG